MIVYLNGKFVSDKKARVSVFDHGFLYGDGVYETIRVYKGKPFLLREHLQRLNQSLLTLRLAPPLSLVDLGRVIQKVIQVNRNREAVVRVVLTRGPGPFGFDATLCRTPTLLVSSAPFDLQRLKRVRRGITAAVVSLRRNDPAALPPSVKSTSCLNGILAKMEAADLGAQEGLFLSGLNHLTEGTISNVFLVQRGMLRTPRADGSILPGVTRELVLRWAGQAGMPVDDGPVTLPMLVEADEVFLTSSLMEIAPVRRIVYNVTSRPRSLRVGNGRIGPITRFFLRKFRAINTRR